MTTFIAQNSKGDTFCVKVAPDHHVGVVDMLFDFGYKLRICDKYHYVKMAEEGKGMTVRDSNDLDDLENFLNERTER